MERSKIAAYLLKIKAVRLQIEDPFTWSSGWRSPIYCDNRLTLSYPTIRNEICKAFVSEISTRYPDVQGIAGVATGAIAHGVLVAHAMDLPFVYIRSSAKSHGMKNLVEGALNEGDRYVVIEDLVSTGGSSTKAVAALQERGAHVLGTLSIFTYGFPQAETAFAQIQTPFHSLTDLETLMEEAIKLDYLQESEKNLLRQWQKSPETWGKS